MKKNSLMSIWGLALSLCVMNTFAEVNDEIFGSGAKEAAAVDVNTILAEPTRFLDKEITVAGKVVSVCDKRGCWMMLSSGNERLRIKVNDGEMVFPFNAKGKKAYATGKLEEMKMTQDKAVAYLKHMADDAGESFDESQIKGDVTLYQLRPTGVTIKR